MKKITRHSVFETNSSSTHSFSVSDKWELETILPNESWNIILDFDSINFWWESTPSNANERALYIAKSILYEESSKLRYSHFKKIKWSLYEFTGFKNSKLKEFEHIMMSHTWASKILYRIKNYDYIDYGVYMKFWHTNMYSSKVKELLEKMLPFIFGKSTEVTSKRE